MLCAQVVCRIHARLDTRLTPTRTVGVHAAFWLTTLPVVAAVHVQVTWLCVLTGRMRLVLGAHDQVLGPGEVAEFDTRIPHWFGSAGNEPGEVLSVFGQQGERMHVRAKSRAESAGQP